MTIRAKWIQEKYDWYFTGKVSAWAWKKDDTIDTMDLIVRYGDTTKTYNICGDGDWQRLANDCIVSFIDELIAELNEAKP